jgi:hypothetical protein
LSPKKKGNKKLQAGEKPDPKTAARGAGEGRACKARKMKVQVHDIWPKNRCE